MATATPSTTSTGRGFAFAAVTATVVAGVINTVISLIAQALGADASVLMGLQPGLYIVFTLVGVIAGAAGWVIIRARSADPAALLRRLVPTVVAVSLIPDLLLGLSLGWGALALALMHLSVAATAVAAYHRFLPLSR